MTLVRWNPWGEYDRETSKFWNGLGRTAPNGQCNFVPLVDIREDENGFELYADLPGLTKGEVSINVEDGILTISGERKFENEEKSDEYRRVERGYGTFHRSFNLHDHIDTGHIQAVLENGVLKVNLPKREESKPKNIEIAVN